jgi:hypothetical protein
VEVSNSDLSDSTIFAFASRTLETTQQRVLCVCQQKLEMSQSTNKREVLLEINKKGKAVPLQAWSGPEGSRKLRFPDFITTAQDGGKVASLTHRPPLRPGNTPGTHFC